jgi:hypothetical protein
MEGTFGDGDMIDVMMNEDELVFQKGKPKGSSKRPETVKPT